MVVRQHILPRIPVKLLHLIVFKNIIGSSPLLPGLILSFSSLFLLFLPSSPLDQVSFSGGIMASFYHYVINPLKGQYHGRYHDFGQKFTKFKL